MTKPITFERDGETWTLYADTEDELAREATPEDLRAAIEAMPRLERDSLMCAFYDRTLGALERRAETAENQLRHEREVETIERQRADTIAAVRKRAETAESRLREVEVAASQEIAKQRQKAVTYGQRAQAYRDEAVRRGANPEWRPLVSGLSDERALQYALNSLPRPETTTMTEATEKSDGTQNVDMVVPIRVQSPAEKADEVAPSESVASEELEPGQWLYENLGGEWRQADARLRGKYAHIERACIERGRREAYEVMRKKLAAKDREIAELRDQANNAQGLTRVAESKLDRVWKLIDPGGCVRGNVDIAEVLLGKLDYIEELRRQLSAKDAKIAEFASELDCVERVLAIRRGLPTPVEGNALQGYAFIDNKHPINVAQGESHGNRRDVTGTHIDQHRDSRPDGGETSSRGADQGSECGPEVALQISGYHEAGGSEHVGERGAPPRVTQHSGPTAGASTREDEERGNGVPNVLSAEASVAAPAVGSGSTLERVERDRKPIQTSPFRSVAQESAKPWKVDPNVTREQVEQAVRKVVPERDWKCMPPDPTLPGGVRSTEALRKEIRGWLGDVKPSERLSQIICDPGSDHPVDRLDALENYLDEIWTRAQGSK